VKFDVSGPNLEFEKCIKVSIVACQIKFRLISKRWKSAELDSHDQPQLRSITPVNKYCRDTKSLLIGRETAFWKARNPAVISVAVELGN